MTEQHHIVALDWVKGEIEETLKQARQALEAFVENPADATRMRFCLAYLHQVHGTLQMVELYGAALLAEEMEKICLALINEQVQRQEDGQEVLMRAMLQLPSYLDRIKESRRDIPVVLMPLLNDLRAARGESLLTETALFKPDLAAGAQAPVSQVAVPAEQLPTLLKRLRQAYQMSLLGLLKNQQTQENLDRLAKVFERLERLAGNAPVRELWQISAAVIEGLMAGAIEAGTSVKMLLGQTDRQLRRAIEQDSMQPPSDLLKNLLYYVAKSETDTPRVAAVKQRYRLADALPTEALIHEERARMSGPDRDAMKSVVDALCEELARVKDTLDVFVRGAQGSLSDLAALLPTLKQVADTIAVLGLGQQRRVIQEQIDVVGNIVASGVVDEGRLMDVAGSLLFVEASLGGLVSERPSASLVIQPEAREQLSAAQEAVLRESRSALEQAKEAVVAYINSQWNPVHLEILPDLVGTVRGGLEMLGFRRPAQLLVRLGQYISARLLIEGTRPDWSEMDTLADAISGIEYYLEQLANGAGENDAPLNVAERSLTALLAPAMSEVASQEQPVVAEESFASQAVALTVEPEEEAKEPVAEISEEQPEAPIVSEEPVSADIETESATAPVVAEAPDALVEESDSVVETESLTEPCIEEGIFPSEMTVVETNPAEQTGEPVAVIGGQSQATGAVGEMPETLVREAAFAVEPESLIEPFSEEASASTEIMEAEQLESAADLSMLHADAIQPFEEVDLDLPEPTLEELELEFDESLLAHESESDDVEAVELTITSVFDTELDEPPVVEDVFESVLPQDEGAAEPSMEAAAESIHPEETPEAVAEMPPSPEQVVQTPQPVVTPVAARKKLPLPILTQMPEDDFGADDEIREIFIEEAEEVLENINEYFPRWASNFNDKASLTEFRRGFHTLKGSGRMVGAKVVGELAWSIENMLNRVLDGNVKPDQPMVNLISEVISAIPGLVASFNAKNPPAMDTGPLMTVAESLGRGGAVSAIDVARAAEQAQGLASEESAASEEEASAEAFDELAAQLQPIESSILASEEPVPPFLVADAPLETGAEALAALAPETPADMPAVIDMETPPELVADINALLAPLEAASLDPVLLEIFISEAESHLDEIDGFLDRRSGTVTDGLLRALHTLRGSAAMAGVETIATLATPLENLFKNLRNHNAPVEATHLQVLDEAQGLLKTGVANLKQGTFEALRPAPDLVERIQVLARECVVLQPSPFLEELLPAPTEEVHDEGPVSRLLDSGIDRVLDASDYLAQWLVQPDRDQILDGLQGELERMVPVAESLGLTPLAELGTTMARVYQRIITGALPVDQEAGARLIEAHDEILMMLDSLAANLELVSPDVLLAALDELRGAVTSEIEPTVPSPVPAEITPEETGAFLAAPVIGFEATKVESMEESDVAVLEKVDPELLDIFLEEAGEILESTEGTLQDWIDDPEDRGALAALQRHLHTLKGGARLAGIAALADLAHELEFLYEGLADGRYSAEPELTHLLQVCHDRLANQVVALRESGSCAPAEELVAQIAAFRRGERPGEPALIAEAPRPATPVVPVPVPVSMEVLPAESLSVAYDPELLDIFLEEAEEILAETAGQLVKWQQNPVDILPVQQLQRGLHTLKGGARMAEITDLGNLSHQLENLYEGICDGRFHHSPALASLLNRCHDRLAEAVEKLRRSAPCPATDDLIEQIKRYLGDPRNYQDAPVAVVLTPHIEEPVSARVFEPAPVRETVDTEVLDIFLEESDELASGVESALSRLVDNHADEEAFAELMRHLHTLKGGARLAGLKRLGDLAHDWEADLLTVQNGSQQADDDYWLSLMERQQQLVQLLAAVRAGAHEPVIELVEETLPAPVQAPVIEPTLPEVVPVKLETAVVKPRVAPPPARIGRQSDANRAPQEQVRVPAELLEKLVNLAGETSITRGRVEQGVMSFQGTVEEMGATVLRLAEQLRRMDIELESQIMARHGHELQSKYEDFDPLEMDQYSALNQLSKALSESASDLLDIKTTLIDKARDAETLLLQQARINTELQEGLMRTRMVPFSRLVPRLRRIVRQTGQEVGKPVDLHVINAEGEMDRTLLERIVAPLEHMLRNAVDHGIESADKRAVLGKSAEGRVTLALSREGGEVVLKLSDDGSGINVTAVRAKAIERGLLTADSDLSDQDAMQFIFHAGFSTAAQVTQISGRGVGMDVVQSEIKQMGGSVQINSVPGQGTTFIVRLPFTVSVNRALMVRIGEDIYAVPLQQIEGIVRASPYELETYYAPNAPLFEYAGVPYKLHYLGEFVHGHHMPNLVGQVLPLPVLLVRGGDHRVAVQVDALLGSREIVVKAVGAQLATVAGISGATILGDGAVVIILDLQAMLRAAALSTPQLAAPEISVPVVEEAEASRVRTVMVVDDSVTVRKVTSRLLERSGYEVLLAKDGMDAISKLEDTKPDIMLLDIEMPRMDGFEVASLVRHNPRLEDLPIIMITSRTGEKHRERAFAIGVNAYMGKPFVEQQLLETINELLTVKR